jgi:hypothetical protein
MDARGLDQQRLSLVLRGDRTSVGRAIVGRVPSGSACTAAEEALVDELLPPFEGWLEALSRVGLVPALVIGPVSSVRGETAVSKRGRTTGPQSIGRRSARLLP